MLLIAITACEPIGGYKFTFDSAGGEEVQSMAVEIGGYYDLPIPTKEGREFIGWICDGKMYNKVAVTFGSMHFVARWLEWSLIDYDKLFGSKNYKYDLHYEDADYITTIIRRNNLFKTEPEDYGVRGCVIAEFAEDKVAHYRIFENGEDVVVDCGYFQGLSIIDSPLLYFFPYLELLKAEEFIKDGLYSYREMNYAEFISSVSLFSFDKIMESIHWNPQYLSIFDLSIRIEFYPNWSTLSDCSVKVFVGGKIKAHYDIFEYGTYHILVPEITN